MGKRFRITSFGESHGKVIGIIIDGIPAGMEFDLNLIQKELELRRPAQSEITSPRFERDIAKPLSGIFNGKTTGAPLCLIIENEDFNSSKYDQVKLRPSHVDYVALRKFGGFADYRGSGRFSGRITAGFVIAGAIAKQLLKLRNISIFSYTKSIGKIFDDKDYSIENEEDLLRIREESPVRALNPELSKLMEQKVKSVMKNKDSIGGTIKCMVHNFPSGIGGPIFNSLESNLSKAIFSIPAVRGIEFGMGFNASLMKGSEHNDPWIYDNEELKTTKNDSGGIIGGISTGMPIEFNVAIKPTPSIGISQQSVNIKTRENISIKIEGKHDPCIVPRAIVVVEAMTAISLVDFLLLEGKIPSILN
ncbi:MAG: chorismate synthase [Candidatus Lokiarchaeota archaeon]|nr:chorismate synthase [Candidatus Lokiarchaeota archaeon]